MQKYFLSKNDKAAKAHKKKTLSKLTEWCTEIIPSTLRKCIETYVCINAYHIVCLCLCLWIPMNMVSLLLLLHFHRYS